MANLDQLYFNLNPWIQVQSSQQTGRASWLHREAKITNIPDFHVVIISAFRY
jgi:hypothetical protein